MFWKNSKPTDNQFYFESQEKRASFRVSPPPDQPIRTAFKGKSVVVTNLGAVGLSFSLPHLAVGDADSLSFTLPGENAEITVQTKIVDIDANGVCHCQFHGLDEASMNAIHRYMLAVQLKEVRGNKPSSVAA